MFELRLDAMRVVLGGALLAISLQPTAAANEREAGRAILEKNCSRCHAVVAGKPNPLAEAPNLYTVLSTYPWERLEVELSEGIGSRHKDMPQIQFSIEDIESIYYYLHDRSPDAESRRPQ
jgi:mono/diheme cytochrome c family protein